ncbi:MAG: carbamoyltransferase HypF [Rhodanobacteraceae bacterium]|nr:carbamoyltransferase HypF [Rhodanobacteraceae bacterium]
MTTARRLRIRVRGRVQGVGFRPFVYATAVRLQLTGYVLNDRDGVLIEVQGVQVDALITELRERPPPLARIDAIGSDWIPLIDGESGFAVASSGQGGALHTEIGPDVGVCSDCLRELFDPANRRYRYPFITCTHCGPRFTICARLPYDRPQTSLAGFPLCPDCQREYTDPGNRRFHAESTACAVCGPRLSVDPRKILAQLRQGDIVAIKGIGGYHLACDARNEKAVARLRLRKQREARPLALMVCNLASARVLALVDDVEAALLTSKERPIVVLRARPDNGIAAAVSQELPTLGLMLPYTPIHWLLCHAAAGEPDGLEWLAQPQPLALVMTSANPHGEPLVHTDADARERLAGIADLIVDHDRPILVRCDDSVLRVVDRTPAFIRRARGFVPEPIDLGSDGPCVLGVGAFLKNTVCITRGREAFVSQHVGDLDNPEARRFLGESVAHLQRILDVRLEAVACDWHPDFPSTEFARQSGLPITPVQHHHAHVAAVAAEHGVSGPLLGLALDGYGHGDDGAAWGGELLRVDAAGFERIGHLAPLALPGGDRCARETWRCAAAALHALGRGDEIATRFASEPLAPMLRQLLDRGLAPTTSSAGRWFDAACGMLGLHWHSSYEGQGPMALEALVDDPEALDGAWRIEAGTLDLAPLLAALAEPRLAARSGANRFHGTLIAALADWVKRAATIQDIAVVALSGGCLLNRVLAEGLLTTLRAAGLTPLLPRLLPPNDGAISLGQVAVARKLLRAC